MVAGTGLKACCLPTGYQPLCARQGTRPPHHLAHHHWPAIGGSAIYCSALGVATSLFSSKHGLHEHNSFFSSAARGWQMRRRRSIRLREARAQKPLEKPRRRRINAARRAGPENHGAAGLGHSGIVRSQPPPSPAGDQLQLRNARATWPARPAMSCRDPTDDACAVARHAEHVEGRGGGV